MKTKGLINLGVTVNLIYAFVFAKAKIQVSHDAAYMYAKNYACGIIKHDIGHNTRKSTFGHYLLIKKTIMQLMYNVSTIRV